MNLAKDSISEVKNKIKRKEMLTKRHEIKKQQFKKYQKTKDPEDKIEPVTTDMKREVTKDLILSADPDLADEEAFDEFAAFINGDKTPKILITTSERPTVKSFECLADIRSLIPNSFYYPRKGRSLNEVARLARERNFTHILALNERLKEPYSLSFCLVPNEDTPNGPTFVYRLRKWVPSHMIHNKGNPSGHSPELILKGFVTALGRRVARGFASIFPANPEFKGRTVVTLHNQRDFLFLRHHRYIFEKGTSEESNVTARLQELGPRFVLQLRKVYTGCFEESIADFEFKHSDDLYVSRSKFYL